MKLNRQLRGAGKEWRKIEYRDRKERAFLAHKMRRIRLLAPTGDNIFKHFFNNPNATVAGVGRAIEAYWDSH